MTLDEIALSHTADKSSAFHNYCGIYDRLFTPLRDKPVRLLEIGVQFGASIKTWLDYFPNASIAGVDIARDFDCSDSRYVFTQGDQGNPSFWTAFNPFLEPWDIVIDDGPHCFPHQAVSFEHLWPNLASGAFYIIEDCWTWPDPLWKQQAQASGFMTQLVWWLNKSGKQYYGRPGAAAEPLNAMESSIEFIHFYPGLMILKKK